MPSESSTDSPTLRFRPDRSTFTVVVVLLLGTLPLGLSSPWLTPALLLPVAAFVWVLRARVVATPLGCEVCNGLRVRRFGWADVAAFDVPTKGPVVLRPTTGRSVRLTALPRAELRRFLAVGNPA